MNFSFAATVAAAVAAYQGTTFNRPIRTTAASAMARITAQVSRDREDFCEAGVGIGSSF
jgi:hypothetical protein